MRHAADREAKLELQATARRAVDAGRHSVVREAEYPQQTAARLAGSSARFAATTSSETQDQASDRRQSNASDQRRFRETRQTSKADYLDGRCFRPWTASCATFRRQACDVDVRPTKLYIDIDATYLRQVARELRQNFEITSTINARRLRQ